MSQRKLVPPSRESIQQTVAPFLQYLPQQSGFIRPYMEWAATQTDAPPVFHLASALAVLSAACPDGWGMAMGAKKFAPNLYVLVVGRAGAERKSWSLTYGRDLLRSADPERVGDSPGSAEGLVKSLGEHPIQLVVEAELARQFNQMQKGQYLETLKKSLADAFDGNPLSRALANRTESVDNYRLSFIGAINFSWFEAHTSPSDWEGGYIPRFFVVVGKRDRFLAVGEPDASPAAHETRNTLAATLAKLIGGPRGVTFTVDNEDGDPTAAWWYAEWQRRLDQGVRELEEGNHFKNAAERAITPISQKVAMLVCIDRLLGEDRLPLVVRNDDPFGLLPVTTQVTVTMEDVQRAALIIRDLHLPSVKLLSESVTYSPSMRLRKRVICAVPLDQLGITWGGLLKSTQTLRRELLPVVESLMDEGVLGTIDININGMSQKRYVRADYIQQAGLGDLTGSIHQGPLPDLGSGGYDPGRGGGRIH